ncbi:MAG TPA: hypothetical protein VFU21_21490 [Kofleriaceae bacterium]|nr:hypothetical protein [Kofleriaceae bacterium]
MSAKKHDKGYKRSWKNLLLNKRYQLRFTLFMVGLSAVLMALLGWWVMAVADRATTVAINNVLGEEICKDPAAVQAAAAEEPAEQPTAQPAPPPVAEGDSGRPRPVVTIEESEMQILDTPAAGDRKPEAAPVAEDAGALKATFEQCKAHQAAQIAKLEGRKRLIFWVLIAVGTMLVVGLLFYGIKMTHRVAGPLHKVALYMAKLHDGKYDTVYNLRKGDHLVDFYAHFKAAHAGMKKWQEDDVARLKAVIAAAEEGKLEGRSPEMAAALAELKELLAKKEASLG